MVVERRSRISESDLPPEIIQDLSQPVNLETFFSDPKEAYRRAVFYHQGTVPYLRYVSERGIPGVNIDAPSPVYPIDILPYRENSIKEIESKMGSSIPADQIAYEAMENVLLDRDAYTILGIQISEQGSYAFRLRGENDFTYILNRGTVIRRAREVDAHLRMLRESGLIVNEQTLHELEISDGETNVAAISFRLALETALASAVIDEYANVVEDDFFTQTTKPLVIEAVRERIRNNAAYFKSGSGNRDLRQSPLGKAIGTLHSPYLTSHINAWEKALLAKDFDLGVRGLGFILTVDGAQRTNIASGLWSDYLSFMRTRAMIEVGRVDEVIGKPVDKREAIKLLNGGRENVDEWFNVREASTQVVEEITDRNVLKLIYYGQYFGLLGRIFKEVAGDEEWEKWVQEVCIDNATDRSRDWYDFALYAKTILEDRVSMLKIRLDAEEKTLGKRLFREKLPTVKGQPSADQLREMARDRGKGRKRR